MTDEIANCPLYSLTALNAVSVLGRIIPNAAAVRFGPINVLIMSCCMSAMLILLWTVARNPAGIVAYNVAYGIVSGSFVHTLMKVTKC